jgi:hypothetical protein
MISMIPFTALKVLQKIFDLSFEKYKQAQEKEASIVRTFINAKEVSCSLNDAAEWPQKVFEKKHIIYEELERLKNQSVLFEKQEAR